MKTTEDIINEVHRDITAVTKETSAYDAVQTMVAKKVGAILVKDGDEIVGIWTERDMLRNVLSPEFDIKTSKIGELMVRGVYSIGHDVTVNKLLDTFMENGTRYLLVEKNKQYIGLVSIGDAIREYYLELRSYFTLKFYESSLRRPKGH